MYTVNIKTSTGWKDLPGLRGASGSIIISTTFDRIDPTTGGYVYKQLYNDGSTHEFIAPPGPSGGFFVVKTIHFTDWTAAKTATFTVTGYDDNTMAGFPMPTANSTDPWKECRIRAKSVSGETITLECDEIPTVDVTLVFNVNTVQHSS